MNKRPLFLTLYGLMAIGIALSLPLQTLFMFDLSITEIDLAFRKLTLVNYCVGLSMVVLAYAAWIGSPKLHWLATVTLGLVAINNYLVGLVQVNYSQTQAFLGTVLFAIFAYVPYFVPSIRRVLMNPKLRWWGSDHRHSFKAPVLVLASTNTPIGEVLAYDISRSGMFIQSPIGDYYGLRIGDRISVKWMNRTHQNIERDATVVRTAEPSGKYPQGLGLKFDVSVSAQGL